MTPHFRVLLELPHSQKSLERIVIVMDSIILYLLSIIQYQYRQICWLILFIAKYISLKQWAFDDSHSP